MSSRRIVIVLAVLILLSTSLTGHPGFAQDKEKKPDEKPPINKAEKAEKPKPKTKDDVMTRALAWGRKFGKDHKGLARLTAFPSNATEDENISIFIEFGNGNLAIYQGDADAESDSVVVLEKSDLPGLKEAMERSQSR